jgi:hypothetical protein
MASSGSSSAAAATFWRRCSTVEVPGDREDVRGAPEEPRERDLHRGGPSLSATRARRTERREATEREERHVGDAVGGEPVDERVVAAMREVVEVLHTHRCPPARDPLRPALPSRCSGRCGWTLPSRWSFTAQRAAPHRLTEGALRVQHHPQVHHVERPSSPRGPRLVVHLLGDLRLGGRGPPRPIRTARAADLGDDDELLRVERGRTAQPSTADLLGHASTESASARAVRARWRFG